MPRCQFYPYMVGTGEVWTGGGPLAGNAIQIRRTSQLMVEKRTETEEQDNNRFLRRLRKRHLRSKEAAIRTHSSSFLLQKPVKPFRETL